MLSPEGINKINYSSRLELQRLSSVSGDLASIEWILNFGDRVAVRCEQLFPKVNRDDVPSVYPANGLDQSYLEFRRILYSEADRENFRAVLGKQVLRFPLLGVNPLFHRGLLKLDARLRSSGGFLGGVSIPYDSIGLFLNSAKSTERGDDATDAYQREDNGANERDSLTCGTFWETHYPNIIYIWIGCDCGALLVGGVLGGIFLCSNRRWLGYLFLWLGLLLCGIGSFLVGWGWAWGAYQTGSQRCKDSESYLHVYNTVPRKYLLTSSNYWGTVIGIGRANMPNILSTDKQVAVISALAEGSGIRQIERITGVHRDTIMRLGVRVGKGCANLLDRKMRDLSCNHLQFDEVWGFIGKKERHCTPDDSPEVGDVWTFCAIDSDTKIVPSFRVGKRDSATANAFVADVASRLKNRVQISSDALRAYVDAVEMAFGANVDFAQIVKTYTRDESRQPERQYSAPEFVIEEKKRVCGMPDMGIASTSHIERLNGTTRLHMRRLTRLTYAFSKKRENFEAAVALHFAYYNFVKRHNTIRCTPAMAAGIERGFWTVRELVEAAA